MHIDYFNKLKLSLTPENAETFSKCEKLIKEKCKALKEVGETYYSRAYNTANYLCGLNLDLNTILAGFLHGFFIRNLITEEEIKTHVNSEVFLILSTLKKVETIEHSSKETEAENIRNMFVAMAKDMRVIIVKLSDVRERFSVFPSLDKTEQNTLLTEVKDIYSPLAERLGLNGLKGDLEDALFKFTKPNEFLELNKKLSEKIEQRNNQVQEVKLSLVKMLEEMNIKGEISGRQKRISSVYKKIQNKTHSLDGVFDLVALRVIVETIEQCYAVLGRIHTMYRPLNDRFKDYIALPKQNGYQSLHTTVLNEQNMPFEIQIRTSEMHQYAEFGVAAHWVYKEGGKSNSFDKKFGWIRKIMEESKNLSNEEFVEVLKTDIFSGQIFVQSPQGKVISFPEGATPIDFAFAIHSGLGEKCVGAKINGKICPLVTKLNNGDTVEIITSNLSKGPSRDWLNYVVSSGAKSKIKAYFKREMKDENIKKGKAILEQSAKNKGILLYKLLEEKYLEQLFTRYKLNSLDDMYASLGYGGLTSTQVLNKLQAIYNKENAEEIALQEMEEGQNNITIHSMNENDAIVVRGEGNMLTRFAGCCKPIPGDSIVGFVSRGRGVTVHRTDCVNVPYLDKDRIIKCTWQEDKVKSFSASIRIMALDSLGALNEITKIIASQKLNITSISAKPQTKGRSLVDVTLTLNKKEQLPLLINQIKKSESVIDAFRSSAKE